MPRPGSIGPRGVLTASPGMVRLPDGIDVSAWTLGGALPSPTIRARRGDLFQVQFLNQLPQSTTMHWHGMLVPSDADGHPRNAVEPGGSFQYAFVVEQRAGTCWYHPHAHHNTAEQVQRGMAGFLIVSDEEEDALGLPDGDREILVLLQDRSDDWSNAFDYAPTQGDLRSGMLRGRMFANCVPNAAVMLRPGPYRLRILNGSNARVYLLGLEGGRPLTIIGNDAGLLPAPATVSTVYLGVGERLDCIVDLTDVPAGQKVRMRSMAFDSVDDFPVGNPQGAEMDLLELHRIDGEHQPR
ncbi:MAG TPA: multicopper oxidase domain-containing protein [Gemmatimonadales bacterium]|nr:multicopper oxidase domain-containing protein [Gemmatimonadales bacterium]